MEAAPPEDEKTDEELLAELDLPDPDTLSPGDDFSAFMRTRVPERLRRRALRVLWRSNPVLANLDGMVDYGEDFTDSATVVENLQTVYEVGKGAAETWKRHLAALAAEEAERDDEPTFGIEAEAESGTLPPPEDPPAAVAAATPEPEPIPVPPPETETAEDPPAPRHMRFSFG